MDPARNSPDSHVSAGEDTQSASPDAMEQFERTGNASSSSESNHILRIHGISWTGISHVSGRSTYHIRESKFVWKQKYTYSVETNAQAQKAV